MTETRIKGGGRCQLRSAGSHRRVFHIALAACFVALNALPAPAAEDSPGPRLLILGIDGCRPDALQKAKTPNLDSLRENGAWSMQAVTDPITVSGPCWTSMLTGVWNSKHGVRSNDYEDPNTDRFPHFFVRLKQHRPEVVTVSIVNWAPIHKVLPRTAADVRKSPGKDAAVAKAAVRVLRKENPDVVFVAFDDVDHAGHEFGFSPDNADYLEAIETVDGYAGTILEALRARPCFAQERWLILSSTDHGGRGKGHGGLSAGEKTIFLIAAGNGVQPGEIVPPPAIVDVAATALVNLGVPLADLRDLDGAPVGIAIPDRPEPGSPLWLWLVEKRLRIMDEQSHGPTRGSQEWMMAVSRKTGVIDPQGHGPDPGSSEWLAAVDRKLFQ